MAGGLTEVPDIKNGRREASSRNETTMKLISQRTFVQSPDPYPPQLARRFLAGSPAFFLAGKLPRKGNGSSGIFDLATTELRNAKSCQTLRLRSGFDPEEDGGVESGLNAAVRLPRMSVVMKNQVGWIVLWAVLVPACQDLGVEDHIGSVSSDIVRFSAQAQFPNPQPVKSVFWNASEDLTVFLVSYGDPQDCPSGCYYAEAYGLKHKSKIGWLTPGPLPMFDLDSNDTYLFSDDFWTQLDVHANYSYRGLFLPLMIQDPDTPIPVVKRIADGLSVYSMPYYGELLLENPHVVTNREILTILSVLPVFQGDGYAPIRKRAFELLSLLGG